MRNLSNGSVPSMTVSRLVWTLCMSISWTKVSDDFFDRVGKQWRKEQTRCLDEIAEHQKVEQFYMKDGVRLLEFAANAQSLFQCQLAHERNLR